MCYCGVWYHALDYTFVAQLLDAVKSPLVVTISGRVGSKSPIKCKLGGLKGVIVEERVHRHSLLKNMNNLILWGFSAYLVSVFHNWYIFNSCYNFHSRKNNILLNKKREKVTIYVAKREKDILIKKRKMVLLIYVTKTKKGYSLLDTRLCFNIQQ